MGPWLLFLHYPGSRQRSLCGSGSSSTRQRDVGNAQLLDFNLSLSKVTAAGGTSARGSVWEIAGRCACPCALKRTECLWGWGDLKMLLQQPGLEKYSERGCREQSWWAAFSTASSVISENRCSENKAERMEMLSIQRFSALVKPNTFENV